VAGGARPISSAGGRAGIDDADPEGGGASPPPARP